MALIEKREKTTDEDDLNLDTYALGATPYKGKAQRQDMVDDIRGKRTKDLDDSDQDTPDDDDDSDVNWKERYENLRSWSNSKVNTLVETNRELESKVTDYEKRTGSDVIDDLPGNEEEFALFAEKHPQLLAIMERVATKRANSVGEKTSKELADLKKQARLLEIKETELAIQAEHPDWNRLKGDDVFLNWLDSKSQNFQNAIYKNTNDPIAAIEVVESFKASGLYKAGKKRTKTQDEPELNGEDEYANLVETRDSPKVPRKRTKAKWKESDVARMTRAQYAKHEESIDASIAEGTFEYDLSGAAMMPN